MYSQNNEEQYILNYFRDCKGTLLDIGANDGKTLSNSLALIERGWDAVLVEPSSAFERLKELHKNNSRVVCYNCAIADSTAEFVLNESGEHLGRGDIGLLSTLKKEETKRWKNEVFTDKLVDALSFKAFLDISVKTQFQFITIDAEGMDYAILEQMDLFDLGCEMICVEHNGNAARFIDYISRFNMKVIATNAENLIMAV